MSFVEAIIAKRDRRMLRRDQVEAFVEGATSGAIPPEQLAAMLMAICCRGMSEEEQQWLVEAMLRSGETWELARLRPEAIDKHSTGGVGDTVSLVLAPLLAAVGTPVAMMAGRGLGHSQGTLDKLEAVPGFKVDHDRDGMLDLLDACGAAMVAQTAAIAPADRTLYALRDVTGTVTSLPLIVGSIMSKKLALGAGTLVLDIKHGSGAFFKTAPEAAELGRALRAVARGAGVACEALLTDMSQPLACSIGTACEVRAAIEVLAGRGDELLRELSVRLAEEAMVLRGRPREEAGQALETALGDGSASQAWVDLVHAHGGDPDPDRLPRELQRREVEASASGFITAIDTETLGWVAVELGAGRRHRQEEVDHRAGLEVHARLGDPIGPGQPLATLLLGDRPVDVDGVLQRVATAFTVGPEAPPSRPLVLGTVDAAPAGSTSAASEPPRPE